MQLIDEIEIRYFRSLYKIKISKLKDLNIMFGRNDSGKSNVIRALKLFFDGSPDNYYDFDFDVDFSNFRKNEAEVGEDVRKFLYVKLHFNTPSSFQKSLGKRFFVKRQWNISSKTSYDESFSNHITSSKKHLVTRFMKKIRFLYIPAIKDLSIFQKLLEDIYETVNLNQQFRQNVAEFASGIQDLTSEMFESLPNDVSPNTTIGAPKSLNQLFQALDFEITGERGENLSLIRQKGDGIKVRHIPELLQYISENDSFDYHIWGFEEPENSLDFAAAKNEASRILGIAQSSDVQIITTTHSAAFFRLSGEHVNRIEISKGDLGYSEASNRFNSEFEIATELDEDFYLPALARAVDEAEAEKAQRAQIQNELDLMRSEFNQLTVPTVITEGKTDAVILELAWKKLFNTEMPFRILSCDQGTELVANNAAGATPLFNKIVSVDSDQIKPVIALFDYDEEALNVINAARGGIKKFRKTEILGQPAWVGNYGNVGILTLIVPKWRESHVRVQNCPIEYLFHDDILIEVGKRSGLDFKPVKARTKLGSETYELEIGDGFEVSRVSGNKLEFATVGIKNLAKAEFEGFRATFDAIEMLFEEMKVRKAAV